MARCKAITLHVGDRGLIPGHNRPKSLNQVRTTLMPSIRQQVRVAWALRDDHYQRMSRVTVGLASKRIIANCSMAMSSDYRSPFEALHV